MNIKKLFLYVLIVSVAVSALIGIGVIVFGNFGDFETRTLMTTTVITITSILGLACGAYFESGKGRTLPIVGIVSALVSCILWIVAIWAGEQENSLFFKSLASATLIAASCAHLSLLSLARLDRKFIWAKYATHASIWTLLAILLAVLWFEIEVNDNFLARTLGVLGIVIGALTILTPVLHKLSSRVLSNDEIDAEIAKLRAQIEELEKAKQSEPGAVATGKANQAHE